MLRGIEREIAEKVFEEMANFGQYGFNKSHAASYAMLAYRCAWYKAHYPLQFWAALMSSEKDDINRLSMIVRWAQNEGVRVYPPHVNRSKPHFTVERNGIRYGLSAIRGITHSTASLIAERAPYKGFDDFVLRTRLKRKEIEILVCAGALDGFATRAEMLHWLSRKKRAGQKDLFVEEIPKLDEAALLQMELRALGFDLKGRGKRMEVVLGVERDIDWKQLRDELERIKGTSSVVLEITRAGKTAKIRLPIKIDVSKLDRIQNIVDTMEVRRCTRLYNRTKQGFSRQSRS